MYLVFDIAFMLFIVISFVTTFCHQVSDRGVEAEYESIEYDFRSVTQQGIIFRGFRFRQLHTRLLRYLFHNGLLSNQGEVH